MKITSLSRWVAPVSSSAFVSVFLLLGVGCSRMNTATWNTSLSTMLDAVAHHDAEAARAAALVLEQDDRPGMAPVITAVKGWIAADGDRAHYLALKGVVAAIEAAHLHSASTGAVADALTASQDALEKQLPTLEDTAREHALMLRCGEATKAFHAASAVASAVETTLDFKNDERACKAALSSTQAAVQSGDWAGAYAAWYSFEAGIQVRPTLSASALKTQSTQFVRDLSAAVAAVSSGEPRALYHADAWHALAEAPISRTWKPEIGAALEREEARLSDEAAKAASWPSLRKVAFNLAAVSAGRGEHGEALPRSALESIFAETQRGSYGDREALWKQVEENGTAGLKTVAASARAIARAEFRAAAMKQVAALRAKGDFVEAQSTLSDLLSVLPGDAEAKAMVDTVKQEARAERSARVDAAFAAGRTATAFVMLQVDPNMTPKEKDASLKSHGNELDELHTKLTLQGAVKSADELAGKVAQGATATGPGWELMPAVGTTDADARRTHYYPLEVRLVSHGLNAPPKQMVRQESAQASYQTGVETKDNPEKPKCEQDLITRAANLAAAKLLLAQAEAAVKGCQAAANQGGGIFSIVGGLACKATDGAARIAVGSQEAGLVSARAACAETPRTIQVPQMTSVTYPIEVWRANASVDLDVSVIDRAHGGAVLATRHVHREAHDEDRVIHGDPSKNIPEDSLNLRSTGDLENEIVKGLTADIAPVFKGAVDQYAAVIERDAGRMTGANRAEALARLVVLDAALGSHSPSKQQWMDQVSQVVYPNSAAQGSSALATTGSRRIIAYSIRKK